MDALITSSFIAAFLAGVAALFAPCCITVLLPTYFASIFKERKTVFFMTFIFFLGLLTIFLPLGLGMAGLGELFQKFHGPIFGVGSAFFLFLGIFILLGKQMSLPFHLQPRVHLERAGSVYVLGIFSGIATICCAPVLAGVLSLSVLPGSLFWGGMYSVVYVLGMVIPLFLIAFFIDATKATKKLGIFRKQLVYSIAGREVHLRIADVISGVTFVLMGILTAYLAITNKLSNHSMYQTSMNIWISKITNSLLKNIGRLPWEFWVALFIGLMSLIIWIAFRNRSRASENKIEGGDQP